MQPRHRTVVLTVLRDRYGFMNPRYVAALEVCARLACFTVRTRSSPHLAGYAKDVRILKGPEQSGKEVLIDDRIIIDQNHNVTLRFSNSPTGGFAKIKTPPSPQQDNFWKIPLK